MVFYFCTSSATPKKDNTKKADANKNRKNKPVPTIAKKPKNVPVAAIIGGVATSATPRHE